MNNLNNAHLYGRVARESDKLPDMHPEPDEWQTDSRGIPFTRELLVAMIKGYWRDFLLFIGIKCTSCGSWLSDYDSSGMCNCWGGWDRKNRK